MSALPLDQRLAAVELGLRHVGDLAASTAKGLGKDKTQRQILVFATGAFKQSVLEAKEQWDAGAAAARTPGGVSGADARPVPFKWQLLRLVIEALKAQGLSGEVLAELQALEISCLEVMFLSANDTDRPVILTLRFSFNLHRKGCRPWTYSLMTWFGMPVPRRAVTGLLVVYSSRSPPAKQTGRTL